MLYKNKSHAGFAGKAFKILLQHPARQRGTYATTGNCEFEVSHFNLFCKDDRFLICYKIR